MVNKIIVFIALLVFLSGSNTFGQSFGKKHNKGNFTKEVGYSIAAGGVLLSVAVVATPTEFSKKQPVGWQPTPYWDRTAQMAGLTTGITLTGTGLITALLKRKGRRHIQRHNYGL